MLHAHEPPSIRLLKEDSVPMNQSSSIFWNIVFVFLSVFLALVTDLSIPFFSGYGFPFFKAGYLGLFFLFFFSLSLVKSRFFIGCVLFFCGLLVFVQCAHVAYFGTYMSPIRFQLLFEEIDEILLSSYGAASHLWFVLPLVAIPWYLIFKFLSAAKCYRFSYAWIICLLILAFVPARLWTRPFQDAYPNPGRFCLINSLHSFFGYCVKILPGRQVMSAHFAPYKLDSFSEGVDGIILLIMGESFSSKHMGLYGYERPTTPFLSLLSKEKGFFYAPGYSAGVATKTSLPLFYNVVREPGNVDALESKRVNLFRLAKAHGYETVYISAQHTNILFGVGAEFVDHLITLDDQEEAFAAEKDEALITLFKKLPLQHKKVFVVLHQRSLHFPYEEGYRLCSSCQKYPTKDVPYKTFMNNTYDNGVLYNDQLYRKMIGYFKERYEGKPLYVFITSDHGERLGENGKYGHTELDQHVAEVPWILYAPLGNMGLIKNIERETPQTHYDMGVLIARLLGFEIINPNSDKATFLINGNHVLGLEGYLSCVKKMPLLCTLHQ